MNKYILALVIACITSATQAADIYKRGHDKQYTAGCVDAIARTDGTPLLASEIAKVEYMIDDVDGNLVNPLFTVIMMGGCQDTIIDLQQFPAGDYFRYAITVDTDGLVSAVSQSNPFTMKNAPPNAPGQLR